MDYHFDNFAIILITTAFPSYRRIPHLQHITILPFSGTGIGY